MALEEEEFFGDRVLVDAPVRLARPDLTFPVVGFVRKGARLHYSSRADAEQYWGRAHFPAVPRKGVLREGWREELLPVVIDRRLASETIRPELDPVPNQEVLYGLYRELSLEENRFPFAFVACGRARVVERQGARMKVVAEYGAGELVGWIDAAEPDERDPACDQFRELPRGYERVKTTYREFSRLTQKSGELFVPVDEGGTTRCQAWKFDKTLDGGQPALVSVEDPRFARIEREWGTGDLPGFVDARDGQVPSGIVMSLLYGKRCPRDGSSCWNGSGIEGYYVVQSVRFGLVVVDIGYSGDGDRGVVGYRSSSAETWFLTREACEKSSEPPRRSARDSALDSIEE